MASIIPLKDSTGAQFYPQTHEKAVVDSNGVNLQTKLQSISAPSYVVAWDGDSTPVVANIPAGVTFTYGGNTYTGTLAASSSTLNKTYLVGDNNGNFDEYVTQVNGSTYSWQYLGNTKIDLSDYATKDELNQLDQKVGDGIVENTPQTVAYTRSGFSIAPKSSGKIFNSTSGTDILYFNVGFNKQFRVVLTCSYVATTIAIADGTGSSAAVTKLEDRGSSSPSNITYTGETTATLGYVMITVDKNSVYSCVTFSDKLEEIHGEIDALSDEIDGIDGRFVGLQPLNANYNFDNGSSGWAFGGQSVSITNKVFTGSSSDGGTQPSLKITPSYQAGKRYFFYVKLTPTALYSGGVTLKLQGPTGVYKTQQLAVNEETILVSYVDIATDQDTLTYIVFDSGAASVEVVTATLSYFAIIEVDEGVYLPNVLLEQICANGKAYAIKYAEELLQSAPYATTLKRAWCAIGDSITSQGSYIAATKKALGITEHSNLGVGGLTVADDGDSGMCYDSYLSTIPAASYLITVLGGANDFAQSLPIGTKTSTDVTTYCGALNHIIDYISENFPSARLVIICPTFGKFPNRPGWPDTTGIVNTNGDSLADFAAAAAEVAEYRGIACAKVGQQVGWNDKNFATFLKSDGAYVHPNDAGGARIAAILAHYLLTIIPLAEGDI